MRSPFRDVHVGERELGVSAEAISSTLSELSRTNRTVLKAGVNTEKRVRLSMSERESLELPWM